METMSELSQEQIDRQMRQEFLQRDKMIVTFFMEAERVDVLGPVFEEIFKLNEETGQVEPTGKQRATGEKKKIGEKWEDVPWVEIRAPGNQHEIRRRRVKESDKREFSRQWEAFERTRTQPQSGTPLDKLPFLSRAQVLELRGRGIDTVEQLASVADANGQTIMGFQQLRRRAQDFMALVAGNEPAEKLRVELEQRDAEMAALRQALKEQGDAIEALRKGKKG